MLIGSVGLVDARMLGLGKGIPIKALEKFIPIGVAGFIINLLTGSLSSRATRPRSDGIPRQPVAAAEDAPSADRGHQSCWRFT